VRLIFWLSVAICLYVYVGYPLLLCLAARRTRATTRDDRFTPSISLIIAAFNEEKVIRQKLENALGLDYPLDRLQVLVVSDGSADRTNEIVREFAGRGVLLHRMSQRGGKTRALNAAVPLTTGHILVLSDANTFYRPDALRKLVRHFSDSRVGAVSGDVRLVDSAAEYAASEGLYYRYERWLQTLESRLSSIVGADGGMYALRRELFQPPAASVIVDDFVISMNVAIQGARVLYESEAVAIEQGTASSREEWHRKVRIVAGGIHALMLGQGAPTWRRPALLWSYASHKLLRWLMPCFLAAALISSGLLAASPLFRVVFLAQAVFYVAAAIHALNPFGFQRLGAGAVPYYFCLVNGAAMTGLWKGLRNRQSAAWNRSTR
jgi:cellulose synthase/poly-beta-1,6-N-acetylglucosamine synthase-like glycosyltransferase